MESHTVCFPAYLILAQKSYVSVVFLLLCMIFAIVLQPFFQCGLLGKNGIYLIVQILDHDLGLQVDFIVIFRSAAVFFLLTVLAHHNQRCLNRRHTGQHQIQHFLIGHVVPDVLEHFF